MFRCLLVLLTCPLLLGFASCPKITVCFTPGENCTNLIIDSVDHAKEFVLVQAYSITSESIAKSLIRAKERGVDVKVILDESRVNSIPSVINQLLEHTIPIWIDFKPAIANNKVVIIDNQKIITGSFNFSDTAQRRNAENLLIITGDSSLIERYIQNWKDRQSQSEFCNKVPRSITRILD